MDIFPTDETPNEQPSIFPDTLKEPAPALASAEQAKRTAILAAMAQIRQNQVPDAPMTVTDMADRNAQMISNGMEGDLRNSVGAATRDNQIRSIMDYQNQIIGGAQTLPNGTKFSDTMGSLLRAQASAPDQHAVEKEGIKQIQDGGDSQALSSDDLLRNNYLNLYKMSRWHDEVDKVTNELNQQSYFRDALDTVAVFPFQKAIAGSFTGKSDSILPGSRLRDAVSDYWLAKSPDEADAKLKSALEHIRSNSGLFAENKSLVLDVLKSFGGLSDKEEVNTNLWTAFDAATLPGLGKAIKILRDPASFFLAAGNRTVSTTIDKAAVEGASNVQNPVNAIDHVLPNFAKTRALTEGASEDLRRAIEATQIPEDAHTQISSLGAEAQQQAIKDQIDRTLNKYQIPSDRIVNIDHTPDVGMEGDIARFEGEGGAIHEPSPARQVAPIVDDEKSGLTKLSFDIGPANGPARYKSVDALEADAKSMGLPANPVPTLDGGWVNRFSDYVQENTALLPSIKESDIPQTAFTPSRFFRNPDAIMAKTWNETRFVSTVSRSHLQQAVFGPGIKTISSLGKDSRKALEKVLIHGEENRKWFTVQELEQKWLKLNNALPTDKEKLGYYTTKNLWDAVYHVHNNFWHKNLAREGWNTFSFAESQLEKEGRLTGRVVENPNWSERIFDHESGKLFNPGEKMAARKKKFENGSYRVIELRHPITNPGKEPIRFVMSPKASHTMEALERHQLKYNQGGGRLNISQFFVKQSVTGLYKDGSRYWLDPITHMSADTQARGAEAVKSMNSALKAWTEIKSIRNSKVALDAMTGRDPNSLAYWSQKSLRDNNPRIAELTKIIETSPVKTIEKWEELVKDGVIQEGTPFELLRDGEHSSFMRDAKAAVDHDMTRPDMLPDESYYMSKGASYMREKGERLRDPDQNMSRLLDPIRTLDRAMQIAIKQAAFGDYTRYIIEDWARMAWQLGAVDKKRFPKFDPTQVFFHGEIDPSFKTGSKTWKLAAAMDSGRKDFKRLLGWRDDKESVRQQMTFQIANWVDGKGKIGDKVAVKLLDSMSRNPLSALRGLAYHSILGIFQIAQLPLQATTALGAMAVHPELGLQAAAHAPFMLWANANRAPAVLDKIATAAAPAFGLTKDQYKHMVSIFNTSGLREVGQEFALASQMSDTVRDSMLASGAFKFIHKGTMFFTLAEQLNRAVALPLAYKTIIKRDPELEIGSEAFRNAVLKRTDDLTANMTQASKAYWQTNDILSIPTQFLGYQMRMLENMLSGRAFQGFDRFKFIAGQLVLFGAAGFPGLREASSYIMQQYQDSTGQPMNEDAFRMMHSGMVDQLLHWASAGDLNTDFGGKVGIGASMGDLVNRLKNGDLASTTDVLMGPGGETIHNVLTALNHASYYFNNEQNIMPTHEGWQMVASELANVVGTLKQAHAAYWIASTGKTVDPKTGFPIIAATEADKFATILGIPTAELSERWDILNSVEARKKYVKDLANQVNMIRAHVRQANDDVEFTHWTEVQKQFLGHLRGDGLLQREVVTEANSRLKDAVIPELDQFVGSYEKTLGKEPVGIYKR